MTHIFELGAAFGFGGLTATLALMLMEVFRDWRESHGIDRMVRRGDGVRRRDRGGRSGDAHWRQR